MSVYIRHIFILILQHLRLLVDMNDRTNLLFNVVPYFDLSDIYFTGYFIHQQFLICLAENHRSHGI